MREQVGKEGVTGCTLNELNDTLNPKSLNELKRRLEDLGSGFRSEDLGILSRAERGWACENGA